MPLHYLPLPHVHDPSAPPPLCAGYTSDQLAAGLQLATGLLLMLACFGWPAAWEALTLKSAAITPVYAIVTFCVVLQANLGAPPQLGAGQRGAHSVPAAGAAAVAPGASPPPALPRPAHPCPRPAGAASQFVMMRAAGAVAGGLLGLLCSYLTYFANGSSYASTPTKGAVMVTLLSVFSFCFGLYRFRYPRWWFGFTVATFRCAMRVLARCAAFLASCCGGAAACCRLLPLQRAGAWPAALRALGSRPQEPNRGPAFPFAPEPGCPRCALLPCSGSSTAPPCSAPPRPRPRRCVQHADGGTQPLLAGLCGVPGAVV